MRTLRTVRTEQTTSTTGARLEATRAAASDLVDPWPTTQRQGATLPPATEIALPMILDPWK
ncbi:MAG: hypothetical protein JW751_01085 [Polyangiaceae bacterium]|nr:hypothetical protein [Polyangiaceae bacterium]